MIASFFASTLISELLADKSTISQVKQVIAYAVWFLIPLMALTGITGSKLAPNVKSGQGILGKKKKRMPIVALNGLLILLPCALYLNLLASQAHFNQAFYIAQTIELIAGSINLTLMAASIRDAIKIKPPVNATR
ncbi:hypothetical protein VII00023_06817 [Vibrio ichthyoenteri ATCC 700023]|uniref:Uncharacterized protein n=2 Tax=Vibrio ichthyoenteri TaxID=142461 RepID=F9RYW7_9VIBR|nr:hypothetical protein VII00023_06817 [Vibrio ichthyoenteri ATCC 700023]